MPGLSWTDIPIDLQSRIGAGDVTSLAPLSAWLSNHPLRYLSEDVRQKVLATLCHLMSSPGGRSLLNGAANISELLAKIASRHRADERRTADRVRTIVSDLETKRVSARKDVDPAAILSSSEVHQAITTAFAVLSPLEREVLVRALVLRESYRKIAIGVLGESRGALDEIRLRKLVWRAKKRLQAQLRDLRAH